MILQAEGLPPIRYEVNRWCGHDAQFQFYASCEMDGELYDCNFLSDPYEDRQSFVGKALAWVEQAFRNRMARKLLP